MSGQITVSYANQKSVLDRVTRKITSTADITLTNISANPIVAPLHSVITINNPTGDVVMPDALGGPGSGLYGKYYYDLSGNLTSGKLAPGAKVVFPVKFVRAAGVSFTYNVTPYGAAQAANLSPVANAGPDQTLTIPYGQASLKATLDGSGSSDPDGTISSYSWSGLPKPDNTVKPTVNLSAGTFTFDLAVTDDKGNESNKDSVTITVVPETVQPPVISLSPGAESYSVAEESAAPLAITVNAVSPDGRIVALSASPQLNNSSFAATPGVSASGAFNLAPKYGQAGSYLITFKARDSYGLTTMKTVKIDISKSNRTPLLVVPEQVSVDEGKTLIAPVSASDPDGDILTLSAAGLPANAMLIPATGTISFQPDYTQAGSYPVTLTASDGKSEVRKSLTINVRDVGDGTGNNPLSLTVDPVSSPTFLGTLKLTGLVNSSGPAQPAQKSALITGLAPASGEQGATMLVSLTSNTTNHAPHFAAGTSVVSFGDGITVNKFTVIDSTSATAEIYIAPTATPSTRQVIVTSGTETALSINAFNILKGKSVISGRLVDPATGQAIAGATVVVQGSTLSAVTDSNGTFTIEGVSEGEQTLAVTAMNKESKTIAFKTQTGLTVNIGELELDSTVFDPAAAPSTSVLSVVGRGMADLVPTEKSLEKVKQIVIDSILTTGGKSCGVVDEYGNQLNTAISGNGVVSLTAPGAAIIAERWMSGEVTSLGSLLHGFYLLFEWPATPSLRDTVSSIQTLVDNAWLDIQDPYSAILIAIFNRGKSISPTAPKISPETPLNALQSYLFISSMLAWATNEMHYSNLDPQHSSSAANHHGNPVLLAFNNTELEGAVVSDAFSPLLLADAGLKPVASAGVDQNIEIPLGTKSVSVTLHGIGTHPSGSVITGYYWYKTSSDDPDPPLGEQTVTLKLTSGGNHTFRLFVSDDSGAVSDASDVNIHITGDCLFTTNFDKATASWCKVLSKALDKSALKLANLPADNYISSTLSNAMKPLLGQKLTSESIVKNGWVNFFEEATSQNVDRLRQMAETKGMKELYKNMKSEAAQMDSQLKFIKNASAIVKKSLTTMIGSLSDMVLDPVFKMLIDGIIEYSRPSAPFIQDAELVEAPADDVVSQHVKVTFKPSSSDQYDAGLAEKGELNGIRKYAYLIYRNNERIDIVHSADFTLDANKNYTYIDRAPAAGTNSYQIATRVIRSNTVPVPNQKYAFEAKYVTEILIGKIPGADFTSRIFWKSLDTVETILRGLILQDSDLTVPELVYVGAPTQKMHPTLDLAVDKSVVPNVNYLSIPDTNGIFKVLQEGIELHAYAGFKEPYQAGLAINSTGTLFAENSASDELFGGRIFRFEQGKAKALAGTVNYYSPLLQYARPTSVVTLTYGIDGDGEALFIADGVDQAIKRLDVTPGRMVGLYDRNVGQFYAQSPDFFFQSNTKMHFDLFNTLFLTQGPDLFRVSLNPDGSRSVQKVFPDEKNPFDWLSGIDSDPQLNYYLADFARGDITMVPHYAMAAGNFMELDESIRRRYVVMEGLSHPVDLKVTNNGRGLIVVDGAGVHQQSFGVSGRIWDKQGGIHLGGADVVVNNGTALAKTDAEGYFRVPGLASSEGPVSVRLKVVSIDGRTQVFPGIKLADYGHTAIMDDLQFDPPDISSTGTTTEEAAIDPDPFPAKFDSQLSGDDLGKSVMKNFVIPDRRIYLENNAPPAPPAATMKNDLDFVPANPDETSVRRPAVSVISPANRLVTSNGSTEVIGMVSPSQGISDVRVSINGQSHNVILENGIFRTSVPLREGINIITARAGETYYDPVTKIDYQEGVSEPVQLTRSTSSAPGVDYVGVVGLTDGNSITSASDIKVKLYAVVNGVETLISTAVTKTDGTYRIHVDGSGEGAEKENWLLNQLTQGNNVPVKLVADNYAE